MWKFFFKKSPRIILYQEGIHYNLKEMYDSINEEYFQAKLGLQITWFGRGEQVPKTRMVFGSYHHKPKLIKINRLLDRKEVPGYFIRYIIYHEMLHYVHPPIRQKNGKKSIHHKIFKEKEQEFKEHDLAKKFLINWKDVYI